MIGTIKDDNNNNNNNLEEYQKQSDQSCNTSVLAFATSLDGSIRKACFHHTLHVLPQSLNSIVFCFSASSKVLNVKHFGARGDKRTDETKAFVRAWKEACSSKEQTIFMVPKEGTYLIKPIVFSGPCKSSIIMSIKGTIVASPKRSDWDGTDHRHWILFNGVNNLHLHGGGTINGNGEIWWKKSCKVNKNLTCTVAPTAMTFYSCNNLHLNNIKIKNSQQIQVSIEQCKNVKVSRLTIIAPDLSPNTDGIHVAGTKNIQITSCVIGTGDDCISITGGSKSVTAKDITCGPGHGISIGSLGANNSEEYVSDVVVENVRLNGTTNGVRIKTWQGGRGYARNIAFKNIYMNNVANPIIIDQNYCDSKNPCKQKKSAVAVSNVVYKNIRGTSATPVAVRFDCSKSVGCHNIVLENINLVGGEGSSAKSFCNNVRLHKSGKIVPLTCP